MERTDRGVMGYEVADDEALEFLSAFSALGRTFSKALEIVRKKYGITERGTHILGRIGVGEHYPSELAEHFGVSSSLISFELEKLVAAGFIRREPDPQDGRRMRLTLSDAGDAVQTQAIDTAARILQARLGRLSTGDRKVFVRAFAKVSAGEVAAAAHAGGPGDGGAPKAPPRQRR